MEPSGSAMLGQYFATELVLSQPLILDLNSWTMQWFAPSKVHAYEPLCIYSTLVLWEDKVRVVRINALISTAGMCWTFLTWLVCKGPGLCQQWEPHLQYTGWWARSSRNRASRKSCPLYHCCPSEEKEVEAKKEESEQSDDDMGFGLFLLNLWLTCLIKSKTSLKKQQQHFFL